MKNKYLILKAKHEKLINDFPQFFAFSESQFEEGLKKLNTTKENLVSTGYGGFIKKEDKNKYIEMFKEINKESKESLKDDGLLFDALRYELSNHEFIITYDYKDTLNALGLSYESLTENQINILEKAKENYLQEVENNNFNLTL